MRNSNVKNLVNFFHALSNPTRQKILLLLEKQDRCVSELVNHFNLSQPTISKHLLVLKHAGLVTDKRQGQLVFYSLNEEWMRKCCSAYLSKFECCCNITNPEKTKGTIKKTK